MRYSRTMKESNRFWIVTGLLAAILLVLTMTTSEVAQQESGDFEYFTNRSVLNSKPSGYRAWYLAMERLGLPLMVWKRGFNQLDELVTPATMVIIEPYAVAGAREVVFGTRELELLMNWVSQGNTLILADDFSRRRMRSYAQTIGVPVTLRPQADKRPQKLVLNSQQTALASFIDKPLQASPVSYVDLDDLAGRRSEKLLSDSQGQPVGVSVPFSKGRILLLTVPDLADNSTLQNTAVDNYQWLANLVIANAGKQVIINEFVHGHTDIPDLFTFYYQRTPIGKIAAQLVMGFLFILWYSFSPWRPRKAVSQELDIIDMTAFTHSLASLLYRRNAVEQGLSPYLQRIEQILRRKYRIGLSEQRRLNHLLGPLCPGYSEKDLSLSELTAALEQARLAVNENHKIPPERLYRLGWILSLIQERLMHGKSGQPHELDTTEFQPRTAVGPYSS
jgi:hypothetical protein